MMQRAGPSARARDGTQADASIITTDTNLTRWVCDRAAANRSRANCSTCTWWRQPDLTRKADMQHGHNHQPTTAWFMCLHKPASEKEVSFFDYVKAAIMSARINAPSLAPHVLYMHSEDESFANDDNITVWLKAMGVHVMNARLSFLSLIPLRKRRMERTTGICKMDIPLAAEQLRPQLAARGLDTERVLMTDADVMFAADFTYPRWRRARSLPTFAAGIEFFSQSLNSGVVYFNVSTLVSERPRMVQYAVRKAFSFLVADQSWLQEWFDPRGKRRTSRARRLGWDHLDESVFNARPFVHPWRGHPKRRKPLPWKEPHIWHWHGYKPRDVTCWLRAMSTGTWPLRAWRELLGCAGGSHQCLYQPIKDSGCRHLGRIGHSKCYLRTYTYLLMQHQNLLRLAAAAVPGSD